MKKIIFTLSVAVLCANVIAQKANVTWGDEFKLRKGSTDLEVIHADKTGVFVKESHFTIKTYFVFGATARESATLIKLDKDLSEQYRNNYDKELKGKEYESFFFLKDKLFLLASDYSKKSKTLTLFAAEVDKHSGDLVGDWTEVTAWEKDDKKEDISFRATYNYDSSKMVLVSSIVGREKNNYEVRQFNERLQPTDKPIAITNEFDPKTFQLEDVIYTASGNVVLVGREYEYQEGKKKKNKFLDFKNYNIRVYDGKGQQLKEINTAIDAKWMVTTKVMQMLNKELILAAFYSNQKRGSEINGMLIQRINPATGDIISTNQKELNTGLIAAVEEDKGDDNDDDETKKERKERERLEKIQNEGDGFSRYMRFRNFIPTADNGVVILAEKYNSYSYTSTYYQSGFGNSPGRWNTTTYQVYECGDIFMSKMNMAGNIDWLHVAPKEQREVIQTDSRSNTGGFSVGLNFFISTFNWPFYAGYGVLPGNNSLSIVFNDHKKNAEVLQVGQKVKRASYFGKSDCFAINLNTLTGKYTRSYLFSNNDVPTAMPRLGAVLGNSLYMVGKEDRLLAKTKIAIARLSIK